MWQPLGSVTPQFDLWLPFPGDAGSASVFRFQFVTSGNPENIFSILWFRRVWEFGQFRDKQVEIARQIYPQIHSIIFHLPIPDPLEYAGLIPAGYECKLERRYRKGNYAEPSFYVFLEAFIPPAGIPISEAEIDLKLNQVDFQAIIDKLDNLPNISLP